MIYDIKYMSCIFMCSHMIDYSLLLTFQWLRSLLFSILSSANCSVWLESTIPLPFSPCGNGHICAPHDPWPFSVRTWGSLYGHPDSSVHRDVTLRCSSSDVFTAPLWRTARIHCKLMVYSFFNDLTTQWNIWRHRCCWENLLLKKCDGVLQQFFLLFMCLYI